VAGSTAKISAYQYSGRALRPENISNQKTSGKVTALLKPIKRIL